MLFGAFVCNDDCVLFVVWCVVCGVCCLLLCAVKLSCGYVALRFGLCVAVLIAVRCVLVVVLCAAAYANKLMIDVSVCPVLVFVRCW